MPDKYEVRTHYMPALLCSAPFVAFGFYFLAQLDTAYWNSLLAQSASGITMTFALYYLAGFISRHAGKWLEDRMFRRGNNFPTTRFLLDNDTNCSPERKKDICRKIKDDFGIDLSGKTDDSPANRQRIHEAISGIRQKFFQRNEMVLQRNIQFGFSKNLAGGAFVSAFASVALLLLSIHAQAHTAIQISIVLIVCYCSLSIFSIIAMRTNATRYAHTLFDEFLAS